MVRFLRLDGERTDMLDTKRGVWYSAGCGYWTDDWDKVKPGRGTIPCCPKCSCPGLMIEAAKWFAGAKKYAIDTDRPHYPKFINSTKEKCHGKGFDYELEYEEWIRREKLI